MILYAKHLNTKGSSEVTTLKYAITVHQAIIQAKAKIRRRVDRSLVRGQKKHNIRSIKGLPGTIEGALKALHILKETHPTIHHHLFPEQKRDLHEQISQIIDEEIADLKAELVRLEKNQAAVAEYITDLEVHIKVLHGTMVNWPKGNKIVRRQQRAWNKRSRNFIRRSHRQISRYTALLESLKKH